MSIERVRAYFQELGREGDILEFPVSSATVELAAQAVGVIPARIAKTLSFLVDDGCVLIVAAGDAKIDNPKYKAMFHTKAKMLTPEQAQEMTGHAVGGVCPFAVNEGCDVYLDESLRRFGRGVPGLRQLQQRIASPSTSWLRTLPVASGSTSASCPSRVRWIRLRRPRRLAKPFPQCERRRFERFRRWAWLDVALAERAGIQLPSESS